MAVRCSLGADDFTERLLLILGIAIVEVDEDEIRMLSRLGLGGFAGSSHSRVIVVGIGKDEVGFFAHGQ